MFRTMIATLSMTSAAIAGLAATPAIAQDSNYHYSESYQGEDGSYYRTERTERTERRDGYGDAYYREGYRGDGYRDGGYRGDGGYYRDGSYAYNDRPVEYRRGDYYNGNRSGYGRCTSGTTGTIIGGVLGGLLGREIGRGGRWNRPSTTGLILGAGAGALAGREVERSSNCR